MSYYKTCPRCGAHLDPGESCDCLRQELTDEIMSMTEDECRSVLKLWHDKKTAPSAANTEDGGTDMSNQTISASNDTTD